MTKLILNKLKKKYGALTGSAARAAAGRLAGLVGIGCNVLLFAAKLAIGLLSGSVSITADAVNNLSDASGSLVTLLGFRLSEKPADADHPYGHARIEYLTGLGVAALILVIGVELAKSSLDKILHPSAVALSVPLVVVLVLSIAVKLWMALFNRTLGRGIGSTALEATAADSRNDVLSTAAVLLACVIGHITGLKIDGYMGMLVAVFILISGVGIAKQTISPLLGESADPELTRQIAQQVRQHPLVLGIHDLMVHDYGPGQKFATLHVEMDHREDPLVCHDLIDNIEREVFTQLGVHLTIHYDPIVVDDARTTARREAVAQIVREIDPRLSIHDFRMVEGHDHANLIFDLVVPAGFPLSQNDLRTRINTALQTLPGTCYAIITFDTAAFNQLDFSAET